MTGDMTVAGLAPKEAATFKSILVRETSKTLILKENGLKSNLTNQT